MKTTFRPLRRWWIAIFLCVALLGLPLQVLASVEEAVFAGGCFWCLEHDLEGLTGVLRVVTQVVICLAPPTAR